MELEQGLVLTKLDESVENLLYNLQAYLKGTDRHEKIMDAFNQQNSEKFPVLTHRSEEYPLEK